MNKLLLEAIDSLINDDDDSSSEYIRQALVQKIRTKMGLNEASECVAQLKTKLSNSVKKKKFISIITEILNLSLQGDLEEYSDSIQGYSQKEIVKIANSLKNNSVWNDCFNELADKVITNAEQPDLYDFDIPSDFKECLSQMKPNDLQKIINGYKKDIESLYAKSKTAKLYKEVTEQFDTNNN